MLLSRKWMLASLALAPSLGCLYYWQSCAVPLSDEDSRHWNPDAAAIRREINLLPAAPKAQAETARRDLFATLFKQRYRSHKTALAVCLRFLPDGRIKLMCPARMEPWELDRLAQAAWSETRDNFGHSFNIDIYETYIGAATVKIGEIRPDPQNARLARVAHHYPLRPQTTASALQGASL